MAQFAFRHFGSIPDVEGLKLTNERAEKCLHNDMMESSSHYGVAQQGGVETCDTTAMLLLSMTIQHSWYCYSAILRSGTA